MKYIENDGHVTREYDVKINTKDLETVIRELVTKCYRTVGKKTKVAARTKEEAIEKINAMDRRGIKVGGLIDISAKYPQEVQSSGLSIFDCEYLCKQNSYLVYILETILSNYRSSLSFKNQNYRFIDLLVQFENSDELKPYDERLKIYREELLKVKNSDDANVVSYGRYLKEKIENTLSEMEYNMDYDFELLKSLYEQAKECFDLILVAETIHYKDIDSNPKVYNLGSKKRI